MALLERILDAFRPPVPAASLDLEGLRIPVLRKSVRTLRLSLSRAGDARVTAPRHLSDAEISAFVRSKLGWIRRQQRRLALEAARAAAEEAEQRALTPAQRRALERTERGRLLAAAEALRPRWEAALGVRASGLGIRAMRSRWGSCNLRSGRITLALGLLKHPPECLELILVHELAHLRVRRHDRRFKGLLDRHLPDWRQREKVLKGKWSGLGGMPPFGTENI